METFCLSFWLSSIQLFKLFFVAELTLISLCPVHSCCGIFTLWQLTTKSCCMRWLHCCLLTVNCKGSRLTATSEQTAVRWGETMMILIFLIPPIPLCMSLYSCQHLFLWFGCLPAVLSHLLWDLVLCGMVGNLPAAAPHLLFDLLGWVVIYCASKTATFRGKKSYATRTI